MGATYTRLKPTLPGARIFELYGKASGADSNYGFFAPNIGAKVRGVFDIIDAAGNKTLDVSLQSGQGREAEIRFGGAIEEFTSEEADSPQFRQNLAASLAASVFGKYPTAQQVVLHLQEYAPTSMPEYRAGKRSQWTEIYRATFARASAEVPSS
jgi:hypothetical protein